MVIIKTMKAGRIEKIGLKPLWFSGLGLVMVGILILNGDIKLLAQARGQKVEIKVGTSLSLTVPNAEVELTANPTSTGTFVKNKLTLGMKTNNITGYNLSVTDDNTDTGMIHDGGSARINNVAGDTAEENFAINTWGMAMAGTGGMLTYRKLPLVHESALVLKQTNTANTGGVADSLDLWFGVKLDNTLPSGRYSDVVKLSLVANYVPQNFYSVTSMTEMTSAICNSIPTPNAFNPSGTINEDVPETTLTDPRDGNVYTVRKLADGNCWMVDNLRLGGEQPILLTPENSDVATNFTLPAKTAISQIKAQNGGNFTFDMYPWAATPRPEVLYSDVPEYAQGDEYGKYYGIDVVYAGSFEDGLTEAPHSICPKGWQIPGKTGSKRWRELIVSYVPELAAGNYSNAVKVLSKPLELTMTGTYGMDWDNKGSNYFGNAMKMYALDNAGIAVCNPTNGHGYCNNNFPDYGVNINQSVSKVGWQSVRCVAR